MLTLPNEIIEIILNYLSLKDWTQAIHSSKIFHVSKSEYIKHRLNLASQFNNLDINQCLILASKINDVCLVDYYLMRGATSVKKSLLVSIRSNNIGVISRLINISGRQIKKKIFKDICRWCDREIIEMVQLNDCKSYYWSNGIVGLARKGNPNYIDLIETYFNNMIKCEYEEELDLDAADMTRNWMLEKICRGGSVEIFNFMDDKLGAYLSHGFIGAVKSGSISMIEAVVEKGFYDWNLGLATAASKGNLKLVNYFLDRGANNFIWAFKRAVEKGQYEITILFGNKIFDLRVVKDALNVANAYKYYNIVEYLTHKLNHSLS